MKKLFILSIALIGLSSTSNGQILDSLQAGAASVQYQVLAPSNDEDFSAVPYGDQLLFVSSRETSLFSKRDRGNNQRYFDLYLYDLKTGEVSRYGDELESLKKSKFHLGPATVLPDSAGVILSRNYQVANASGEVNFFLVYENWQTKERYTLPFCSMANSFQHPFYDAKRRRLYFTSNMPGGPGGYDIYFSELLKDNSWGDPVLVEGVNGPRDDVFPTISKDGTLYFSRTESQMGLNLFSFENGEVKPFEAPTTTSRDEFGLIQLAKDSAIFSQSQNGRFNTDIVLAWIKMTDNNLIVSDTQTESMDEHSLTSVNNNTLASSVDSSELNPNEQIDNAQQDQDEADVVSNNSVDQNNYAITVSLQGSINERLDQVERLESLLNKTIKVAEVGGEIVAVIDQDLSDSEVKTLQTEMSERIENPSTIFQGKLEAKGVDEYLSTERFSVVSGVFNNPESAKKQLASVKNWSNDAYISFYEGKFYVISSYVENQEAALASIKLAESNGIEGAWILKNKLFASMMPSLSGSPDLVVYFDFDSADLAEKYQSQIKGVIDEISGDISGVYLVGHTDARGSYSYNDNLSRERALTVSNYINSVTASFGINRELNASGERDPDNECVNGVECDEYAHFLNRRVEIWFY
jgi:outer membrane protein OmpA-like peptidoglycan-associated protein